MAAQAAGGVRLFAPVLAVAAALAPAAATDNDVRSVAGMQHHNRVVLVFAPSLKDRRLTQQRGEMARFAPGAAARDLLFVQVAEGKVLGARDEAGRLRRKFNVPAAAYQTVLLGKDGEVALRVPGPVAAARIEATIDSMPMRREEVRRAKAGLGRAAS